MSEADWRAYRRNLPHLRMKGATYFVTWRVRKHQPELAPAERHVVVNAIRHFHGQRYDLLAFVVMNDHVHVVTTPNTSERLEDLVHTWKSYTARRLQKHGRLGAIWLDEYFDRVIRDESELVRTIEYIIGNPVKRWPDLENYEWVWSAADQTE